VKRTETCGEPGQKDVDDLHHDCPVFSCTQGTRRGWPTAAYFTGERKKAAPFGIPPRGNSALPEKVGYDFSMRSIADVAANTRDRQEFRFITLRSGRASYGRVVLPPPAECEPDHRLCSMASQTVRAGATVVASLPATFASPRRFPGVRSSRQFKKLATKSGANVMDIHSQENTYGKGRVIQEKENRSRIFCGRKKHETG